MLPGEMFSYFSVDTAEDFPGTEHDQIASFPPEYLNSINISGMPLHELKLKCEVISGSYKGTRHFIPRMELCPTETRLPFKLCRKQMPLQICYAMTINKAQGQSLQTVGLFLPKSVFTHGQLYVAVSRVTSPQGLKFFIADLMGTPTNITQNVVYKEVFYNVTVTL
ncbi:ATP-dependent DNA helicase [Heracleum sosnowskyi]|uniref:ATP-dependent DNA helicase n=1 Tax=Heracleum sosnowskyi TaxID=360622 RepID=A0AAD8N394_9APIA|nr:ATP-dependent DNA helicase [Heracleum sosnowskyi]